LTYPSIFSPMTKNIHIETKMGNMDISKDGIVSAELGYEFKEMDRFGYLIDNELLIMKLS